MSGMAPTFQGKAPVEREPHLVAEDAAGARPGGVGLAGTVLEHVREQPLVLVVDAGSQVDRAGLSHPTTLPPARVGLGNICAGRCVA